KREYVTGWKTGDHPREERSKQSGKDPMREAAQGLTFSAMPVWKYLGNKNPDDRCLPDGVRSNEGKNADWHDRKMLSKKRPGHQSERADVAERANKKKRASSQSVNQPEANKGKNEIGNADADRLQQRRLCPEPSKFKDARSEVENRVDAGELIEERNQNGQQNRFAQTPCPEMCRRSSFRRSSHNLVRLGVNLTFGGFRLNALQHFQSARAVALTPQQPARAFGKAEAKQSVEKRGKRGHAQHPSPGILADPRQQRVRHESDQDAKNNVELKHARQPATLLGRSNFRNVQRSRHSRNADAQTTNDPCHDEHGNVCCQPGPDRTHKVKDANPQQRGFASEAVSRPAPDERSHHGAVERGSHRNPVESGTQSPKRLNCFLRARDDDRVKTKKKPGQCRR